MQLNTFIQRSDKNQNNILNDMKLDQALKVANKKAKCGYISEAKQIYKDILQKFPRNKRAHDKLLALSVSLNNTRQVAQDPDGTKLKSMVNLYSKGYYHEAFTQSSKLLKEFPNSATLYNIKGAASHGLGRLDQALEAYNNALAIKPDYALAYSNMANALRDQNRLEEAIKAYSRAISIKPDFADAYNNMGIALRYKGTLEEAVKAHNKAISLKPNYSQAYINMGNALAAQDKLREAIAAYTKAISLNPDNADAHYNIGISLHVQGKSEEAIMAYNKAISLDPDNAEFFNNLGITLHYQDKLQDAIAAYTKAISLNPDNADAYYNMGITLNDLGKLDESIMAYNKAILLNLDNDEVWNNLYYPLQSIKLERKCEQNLSALYPKGINSNYNKIKLSILDYRLHRGLEGKRTMLEKVMKNLSSAEGISVKNPVPDKKPNDINQLLPHKIVALVHFGRSGTGLMHSLIDGHPEVSTFPSVYFSEYFDHSTWLQITSAGWDRIIDRFIKTYEVLFDASSSVPVGGKNNKLMHNIGHSDGMVNIGDDKDEVLRVSKTRFKRELKRLINCYDELDASIFFKLAHMANDKALNDTNSKNLLFYHIHNPSAYAQLNFTQLNPKANWLVMVREPIQSCESWIRTNTDKNYYLGTVSRILNMLFEIDNPVYSEKNTIGVRLEDLKVTPQKTIHSLCKWMGIEERESLFKMTAQGKKWWGDPTSPDYLKDGMEPFGKTSIKRNVGSFFSEKDQFILSTLFYPFSVRFGYREENEGQFKKDLGKIRPMIDEMFDFEKNIADKMQVNSEKLIGSASYLYFRSGLAERWNTLNEFYTYPNMIRLLKI